MQPVLLHCIISRGLSPTVYIPMPIFMTAMSSQYNYGLEGWRVVQSTLRSRVQRKSVYSLPKWQAVANVY